MAVGITRRIEFDAGHRIPDHKSKCRNIHGHRYVLECTIEGPVIDDPGAADNGMVVDFGDLKNLMTDLIGEPWDHALLVWKEDKQLINALELFEQLQDDSEPVYSGDEVRPASPRAPHKTVVLDFPPTVERLAIHVYAVLARALPSPIRLSRVKMWETPNCFAEIVP